MIALAGVSATALGGCGSSAPIATTSPPPPVQLAVLIGTRSVEASPTRVGAGPVTLEITNQASRTLRLAVAGRAGQAGSTAPIDPGATGELTVELARGSYTISAASMRESDAQLAQHAQHAAIAPAHLQIGPPRVSGDGALLQP